MKITLAEIKSLEDSLSKIFEKDVDIKVAYRLSSVLKRLSEEMEKLEESRIKLIKKYGTEDEETKSMTVLPEQSQIFIETFNDLMQLEIELDFEPILLDDLDGIKLSAKDILGLSSFLIKCEDTVEKAPAAVAPEVKEE
ncbi:MAG: hypothetical protein KAH05_05880 [Clostridiales bacterium]|nr:hypothetical protein [Clostridiales bacterium]